MRSFTASLLLSIAIIAAGAAAAVSNTCARGSCISPEHKVNADRIIKAAMSPPLAGLSWDRLAEMTDTFGPRVSGSQALESSIGMQSHQ